MNKWLLKIVGKIFPAVTAPRKAIINCPRCKYTFEEPDVMSPSAAWVYYQQGLCPRCRKSFATTLETKKQDKLGTQRSQMTDRDYTIVGRYGAVLEKRSAFFGCESDLPFPKEEIRTTLLKALQDPGYVPMKSVVNLCLKALDTYVPDEEYEKTQDLVSQCFDLVRRGDSEGFSHLLAQVSEHQRRAFQAVIDTNSKARSVAGELPVLEEKLRAIEAIVDKISKTKR